MFLSKRKKSQGGALPFGPPRHPFAGVRRHVGDLLGRAGADLAGVAAQVDDAVGAGGQRQVLRGQRLHADARQEQPIQEAVDERAWAGRLDHPRPGVIFLGEKQKTTMGGGRLSYKQPGRTPINGGY